MGKVIVKDVILRNHEDEILVKTGHLPAEQIREIKIDMIADTGARAIGLPLSIVEKLGLTKKKTITTILADGEKKRRPLFGDLKLQINDRDSVFTCVGKPEGAPCILGQIVLEELDYLVDCPNNHLITNPESPDGTMLYEDY